MITSGEPACCRLSAFIAKLQVPLMASTALPAKAFYHKFYESHGCPSYIAKLLQKVRLAWEMLGRNNEGPT